MIGPIPRQDGRVQTLTVVASIGVEIPALWVAGVLVSEWLIWGHEAAEGGGVVTGAEVIQAAFAIAFFAGEFVAELAISGSLRS